MENPENMGSLKIKIIQIDEIIEVGLNEEYLNKSLKIIYDNILKTYRIKKKDAYISNPSGKTLSSLDLNLPIRKIIEKYGSELNLYNEKIM